MLTAATTLSSASAHDLSASFVDWKQQHPELVQQLSATAAAIPRLDPAPFHTLSMSQLSLAAKEHKEAKEILHKRKKKNAVDANFTLKKLIAIKPRFVQYQKDHGETRPVAESTAMRWAVSTVGAGFSFLASKTGMFGAMETATNQNENTAALKLITQAEHDAKNDGEADAILKLLPLLLNIYKNFPRGLTAGNVFKRGRVEQALHDVFTAYSLDPDNEIECRKKIDIACCELIMKSPVEIDAPTPETAAAKIN